MPFSQEEKLISEFAFELYMVHPQRPTDSSFRGVMVGPISRVYLSVINIKWTVVIQVQLKYSNQCAHSYLCQTV